MAVQNRVTFSYKMWTEVDLQFTMWS